MFTNEEIENKILLGDSLQLLKKIPADSIDLIVTDPPYIVNGDTNSNVKEWKGLKSLSKIKKGLNDISDGFNIEEYFYEWNRILKKFNAFIFCSNHQISEIMNISNNYGFYNTVLVWHKTNAIPLANGVWKSDLEYCVHVRQKCATFQGNSRDKSRIYTSPC